jgi:hypothetical protein
VPNVHAYSVYGFGLGSDFPIPELSPVRSRAEPRTSTDGSAPPDIVVQLGDVRAHSPGQSAGPDESWAERNTERNETLCVFDGVGRYLIEAGRTITIKPDPAADFDVVRHVLLGPVLAHLLWQRGIFTLHASVLALGGRHVAFAGVSGEGKSTTAAALEASGHALVCDDVAALVVDGDRLKVLPGFPRMRLYADSLRGVGTEAESLPFVHSQIDKRLKPVARFVSHAVQLDRLYLLATGDAFAIEPLAGREVLMEVLRHTYHVHQYAPLYGFKHHFERATQIVERVAAFRLTRPKDLARLPELVSLLEAHQSA